MKNGPKGDTKFHGILAIGNTMEEAANSYRLLAMGKGAVAKVSQDRAIAFVTTAGDNQPELFNPLTGHLNLRDSKRVLAGLQFEANAAADVEANHYVCTSSCGQHIVYDSEALVRFCPVCTASVASDEEDLRVVDEQHQDAEDDAEAHDDEDELDDEDQDLDDEEIDEAAEEDEDDEGDDESLSGDDDECGPDCPGCPQCETGLEDEEDEDEDEEDDEEDDSAEASDNAPLIVAASTKEEAVSLFAAEKAKSHVAVAGAENTVEVNYMVCSSAECNAHVLSEQDGLADCPSCKSTLVEPAKTAEPAAEAAPEAASGITRVLASEDDEDEDDDEEEDDDLSVVDEEDEDEDDEEDDSAEASAVPVQAKARKLKVKTATANTEAQAPAATAAPAAGTEGAAQAPVAAAVPAVEDEATQAPVAAAAPAQAETVQATGTEIVQAPVIQTEAVTVDLLEQLPDDASATKLDVSMSAAIHGQAMWTAYYEGRPVATARVADVGKNADLFGDAKFGHATIAGAKAVGVKSMLKEMGFKAVTATAHIPAVINEKVAAEVATAKSALSQEQSEFTERFMAALASSAIGINRGFFAGVSNPVKVALWNALSAAGIKNPEVLIDNAFRESGDAYHKTLFAQANDIIAKPLEVQESLAKAILGTSYMGVAQASSSTALEDRLSEFGTVTASAEVQAPAAPAPVAAPTGDRHVSAVVAGLGRRNR